MGEEFLMILEKGPYPDKYVAPAGVEWPLPEIVMAKGHVKGAYKKVFESKGPADEAHLRGAKYVWDEDYRFDVSE